MVHDERAEANERRQQILEAALKVFSSKGFHKATNKDIAQAAGISPGLIYWYFKDKEDLLLSIVRDRVTLLELVEHPEQLMNLPPRAGLRLLAHTYMNIMAVPGNVAFVRIIVSEVARFPQVGEMLYRSLISKLFHLINSYLQHQVAQGVFRPIDTATAARSFVGMMAVQMIAREILRQPEALATPTEQVVATIVDIFVRGLEAEGQPVPE